MRTAYLRSNITTALVASNSKCHRRKHHLLCSPCDYIPWSLGVPYWISSICSRSHRHVRVLVLRLLAWSCSHHICCAADILRWSIDKRDDQMHGWSQVDGHPKHTSSLCRNHDTELGGILHLLGHPTPADDYSSAKSQVALYNEELTCPTYLDRYFCLCCWQEWWSGGSLYPHHISFIFICRRMGFHGGYQCCSRQYKS